MCYSQWGLERYYKTQSHYLSVDTKKNQSKLNVFPLLDSLVELSKSKYSRNIVKKFLMYGWVWSEFAYLSCIFWFPAWVFLLIYGASMMIFKKICVSGNVSNSNEKGIFGISDSYFPFAKK